jgi:outer membrane protein assembly factor BamE (lipoprotein component of BamABCDE complex)
MAVGIGVVALLLFTIAWICRDLFDSVFADEYERFRSVQVGMSEEDVRRILGAPYKIHFRSTAAADYYEQGYSFTRRPITTKVFVYIATEPIAYVYFDEMNQVEEVFVGGS